jgi:hypothetical protein
MHKSLVLALLLTCAATAADARRYHRYRHFGSYTFSETDRETNRPFPASPVRREPLGRTFPPVEPRLKQQVEPRLTRQAASPNLVPPDWLLEPSDPNWKGYRYVSPAGDATAVLYTTAMDNERPDEHWKSFAFRPEEEITDLTRRREWGEVGGLKGERAFYRKAAIDCHERVWRHVELEFPAGAKSSLDPFIERVAHTLDFGPTNRC